MKPRSLAAVCAGLVSTVLAAITPAVAAPGHQVAASASAVAPGSYLAVVEQGPDGRYGDLEARSQRLVLVSATGETHTVYTRRVSRTFGGFVLLDWSLDGRTALLTATKKTGSQAIVV